MTTQILTEKDQAAVAAFPARIVEAWAKNDAEAFAAAFTEDATMVLPGVFKQGRTEIGAYMAAAYDGFLKGTRVTGSPIALRPFSADSVLLITAGGVLFPGETEVAAERAIRASWLLARQDGEWLLTAYQNSPANIEVNQ